MDNPPKLWAMLLCSIGRHDPNRGKRYYEEGTEYAPCRHCGRPLRHRGYRDWRA
ncbi:hypothetical protein [Novosphingobium pokkalii]|uniref:Uncharacterized protein n=1 Tax=Novosphingobium pokkalii TaxID=1770194 RepID=A0ABV7V2C3_9SPHN|nr:hypothetical protein [Novosphingobium pokkalii]GHC83157.1 hypothetical protein GCM10019060_02380 [Novosphingobium pokkalii]